METTVQISEQDQQNAKTEVNRVTEWANNLAIKTPEDSTQAQDYISQIKAKKTAIHDKFDPSVRQAHKAWKAAKDLYNFFVDPLEAAERVLKRKVVDYQEDVDRKARKKARDEQAKHDQEERDRQDKLNKQADKAEEKGKPEKAEALRESAQEENYSPPQFLQPQPAMKKGSFFKENWKGRVIDMRATCQAILDNKIPPTLLMGDEKALNAYAKTIKTSMQVPGIKIYVEKTFVSRKAT